MSDEIIEFRGAKIIKNDIDVLKEIELITNRKFIFSKEFKPGINLSFRVLNQKVSGITIFNCDLKTFPESISNLKSLTYLKIWNNKLSTLPDTISKLSSLRELVLGINQISSLPESIGRLNSLKYFDLIRNLLTELPLSIRNLKSLENLTLKDNKLNEIPTAIYELKSLKILRLNNNNITKIPESIGKLKSLEILSLKNNYLETLPESIGELHSLKELDISGNPLKTIPKSIENLRSLQKLEYSLEISHLIPEKLRNRLLLSEDSKNIVDIQKIFFSYENDLKVLQVLKDFLELAAPSIKKDFHSYLGAAITNRYFSNDIFKKEMVRTINENFSSDIRDELNDRLKDYLEKEQLRDFHRNIDELNEVFMEKIDGFYKNYNFLCEYGVWKNVILVHCKFSGELLIFNEHIPYNVFKRKLNKRENFVFDQYKEVNYDKSIWYDYVEEIWFKSSIQISAIKNQSKFEDRLIEEVIEIIKFIENPQIFGIHQDKDKISKYLKSTGYLSDISFIKIVLFNEDYTKEKIFSLIEESSRLSGAGISIENLKQILKISEDDIKQYIEELQIESRIVKSGANTYRKKFWYDRSRIKFNR